MIKLIVLIKKKPDISAQAFRDYYENNHVPLIRSIYKTIGTYVRNYPDPAQTLIPPGANPIDFDVVTELWFKSREDYDTFRATGADPANRARITADEAHFLITGQTRRFVVEECVSPAP